jgi:hypothetical protein
MIVEMYQVVRLIGSQLRVWAAENSPTDGALTAERSVRYYMSRG